MVLANKRITKALIRLRGCAGWSAPLLFASPRCPHKSDNNIEIIKTLPLGKCACFLSSADILSKSTFSNLSGIQPQCQTVWIQIRPDVLLGLIWVQTVCKCFHQTTLVGEEFSHKYVNL